MDGSVVRHKKRGLSLSTTPQKAHNDSQEKSVVSQDERNNSQEHHKFDTDRSRQPTPYITFTYLNPVNSSAKLEQVVRFQHAHGVRRNNSMPKHQWIPQPMSQSLCASQPQQIVKNTQVAPIPAIPHQCSQPVVPTCESKQNQITCIRKKTQENQKKLLEQLEQKNKYIKRLEDSSKVQESRIEFLHKELKDLEQKLKAKEEQLTKSKLEFTKQLEEAEKQKDKMKSMVVEVQRSQLSATNKENRGERKRLDMGKMNEIEAKLNRLISDIKT